MFSNTYLFLDMIMESIHNYNNINGIINISIFIKKWGDHDDKII